MLERPPQSPSGDDIATTSATALEADQLLCPVCWRTFTRIRRQRYCSDACRKTAWTRKKAAEHRLTETAVPQPIRRRDTTIYECQACETRYHGEQWCHDCNQPCTRVGLGGSCPHCDEPVALADLLDPQEALNR